MADARTPTQTPSSAYGPLLNRLERRYDIASRINGQWFFRAVGDYIDLTDVLLLRGIVRTGIVREGDERTAKYQKIYGRAVERLGLLEEELLGRVKRGRASLPEPLRDELETVFENKTFDSTDVAGSRLNVVEGLIRFIAKTNNRKFVAKYVDAKGEPLRVKISAGYLEALRLRESVQEFLKESVYGAWQDLLMINLITRNRTKLNEDLTDARLSTLITFMNPIKEWEKVQHGQASTFELFNVDKQRYNLGKVHDALCTMIESVMSSGKLVAINKHLNVKADSDHGYFIVEQDILEQPRVHTQLGKLLLQMVDHPGKLFSYKAAKDVIGVDRKDLSTLVARLKADLAAPGYLLDYAVLPKQGYVLSGLLLNGPTETRQ